MKDKANLLKWLFIILFVTLCPVIKGEIIPEEAETKYGGGTGEPNDPYLIYTPEQLNTIGTEPNELDKHFKLMADIDLSQYTGTQFNVIGYFVSDTNIKPFTGVFDGNSHTISNFTYTSEDKKYVGLFGYVGKYGEYPVIKDLRLTDPNINAGTEYNAGSNVGSLAGITHNATITGCCVENGTVSGQLDVGGLIGSSISSTISSCYSTVNVQGVNRIGGLVGWANSSKFVQCHSSSTITGQDDIGGLLGGGGKQIDSSYSIGNVQGQSSIGGLVGYNHANITSCFSTVMVMGTYENAGGLVGYNHGTLKSCRASGSVEGNNSVGGLAGYNNGTITHCYATGSVYGNNSVAGFVGSNKMSIRFSYSTGPVAGSNSVAGFTNNNSVYLCYWDIETSGVKESHGGKGKTTTQMQSASTYPSWGYGGQWILDDGNDYPRLIWEDTPGEPFIDQPRKYGGGTGEPNNPYQIRTAKQFASIAYYLEDYNKHFLLTNDIDLSTNDPNEFTPIGINGFPFTGSLVGNGYSILNFKYHAEGQDYIGLYGYIGEGGYVENVRLVNATVTGSENVGALAGYNRGTIRECSVQGTIEGHIMVGGIAGFNEGSITKCSSSGKVTGYWITGGLIGHTGYLDSTITECFTNCEVTGDYSLGGLIGYNRQADIQACYSNSSVAGRENVGGLVGTNESVGFVAGRAGLPPGHMRIAEQSHISSCYFTGLVQGHECVGGLVGENQGLVMFCYSIGLVNGVTKIPDSSGRRGMPPSQIIEEPIAIGGLIGDNNYGTALLSYWDTETSGQLVSAGGRGKTTGQMMTTYTFRGWGYSGEWVINEGNDYPRLLWEGLAGDVLINVPNRYAGGAGEPNNPYRIRTPEDFIEIGYYPGDWDKSFVLTNNLDLNDVDPNLIFPIGAYGLPFLGVFDGNNYTISNFKYLFQNESYLGVFGSIGLGISTQQYDPDVQESQGIIQNLNLENADISGFCYVGGLAGVSNGIISNCSVNGSITAALEDAGGLSGYNTGEIIDCSSNCIITAQRVAGTLIGYNEGPVTACSCEGNVETDPNSSYSCTGGLIGNNYNIVKSCHFNGYVAGSIRTGGLIGLNAGDIINCSAEGDVTGTREVGGLVGYNSGEIMNCYAEGNVNGEEYVAGLAGGGSNRFIANCYASCIVIGQDNTAGLLGRSSSWGDIMSCFWDADVSGMIDGVADQEPDPEGVIGLNTIQMHTKSTFTDAGWDFAGETVNGTEDIWWIDEGQDYPRLWWELDQGGSNPTLQATNNYRRY